MVGGREKDSWVPINRKISNVVSQLAPRKSEGRFFLRYSEGENTGRLELAEWLKKLFADHHDKHIAWFDPYMEDVGINLINQYGSRTGNYLIFTGVPKESPVMNWADHLYYWSQQQDMPAQQEVELRISKLKVACKVWANKYKSVRLRVIGLPEGDLHDRMILIRNASMEPVAGYHLSNSIQRANENYPLLITPMPTDVLYRVMDYADAIIRTALENTKVSDSALPNNKIIFDSAENAQIVAPIDIQNDIYKMPRAGEVFAWWLEDFALSMLSGKILEDQLEMQGLLSDGNLTTSVFDEPPNSLWSCGIDFLNFNSAWDVVGIILANTKAGDSLRKESSTMNSKLSEALYAYLDSDRRDAIQPSSERYGVINMSEQLRQSLPELMKHVTEPSQVFGYCVTEVSWGDYYAIKVLWLNDPLALVRWIEEGVLEKFESSLRRQLGLKCAVRMICCDIEYKCSKLQLDLLLASTNDFLRWMGFLAFERVLQHDPCVLTEVNLIPRLEGKEKVQFLGWLVKRSTRCSTPIREKLLMNLIDALPEILSDKELAVLLDSMRNPLRRIYDNPPWIFQDIVKPLIELDRLNLDLAAKAWLTEVIEVWNEGRGSSSLLFCIDSEGVFTDEVANLFAFAGHATQKHILASLKKELAACGRIIRRPFSSQISWSKYDKALVISLWIAAILDRLTISIVRPSLIDLKLYELLFEANDLVSRRFDSDWKKMYVNDIVRYRDVAKLA